jgi:hypothetical protein
VSRGPATSPLDSTGARGGNPQDTRGGAIAGIVANATGYVITGRLFHPYQAKTPNTWRATESWTHYQYATAVRIAACIGIGFLYAALGTASLAFAANAISRGVSCRFDSLGGDDTAVGARGWLVRKLAPRVRGWAALGLAGGMCTCERIGGGGSRCCLTIGWSGP